VATLANQSSSREQRLAAVRALATSKDPMALESLVNQLETRDEAIRHAALESMKKLKAAEQLVAWVQDPKQSESNRHIAAKGLRYLRDNSSVVALSKALKDSAASVRAEAALALAVFGAAEAETALIAALDDSYKDVRYYAADALSGVKTASTKSALQMRLEKESDETVRFALKGALEKVSR
jgi:HEAT repeat protein